LPDRFNARDVEVGDFNSDGMMDIVAVSAQEGITTVHLGNGTETAHAWAKLTLA
jgi:hypothetical protein